ncbi:MAG TPA: RyR domain-containing protein [Pirellulales bacterium]|jgi:ryanodine receptor 2|nr:RyR domain-containing protein [Pirellulales bacterium]HEX4146849.1 RyR domain-containing protein [Pirellulales bacterium]
MADKLPNYTPSPIDTSQVELSAEILALTERLAEHAHDIWAQGRMDAGWTYGPVRDDPSKRHPCLIAYRDLPDSEKQYDRSTALGTLKAIIALGYRITKS